MAPPEEWHGMPDHSMRIAHLVASETELPAWVLEVAENQFGCSCKIFQESEAFVNALVKLAISRGNLENASNLQKRQRGFWDFELWDAVEEVCNGDPEILEIARVRFKAWDLREEEKREASSLYKFLDCVSDPVLSGLALLALRRRKDEEYFDQVFYESWKHHEAMWKQKDAIQQRTHGKS
jgi:hypothetical protein